MYCSHLQLSVMMIAEGREKQPLGAGGRATQVPVAHRDGNLIMLLSYSYE